MTTFTKENEGKTFIIGQRLSNRQSKARAQVADSYRHVELTFIKITDKCVVYEATLNGITHKVKSMIQMYSDSVSGTNRYIKFTKKAVWGVFHGTIAYEVGFIEKKEEEGSKCGECGVLTQGRKIRSLWNNTLCEKCGEESDDEEEDDVCCVGCGEFVCKYEDEPDHKDERDEAICDECYFESGEFVCTKCSIPLVEDDFDPANCEPYTGECESCREEEEEEEYSSKCSCFGASAESALCERALPDPEEDDCEKEEEEDEPEHNICCGCGKYKDSGNKCECGCSHREKCEKCVLDCSAKELYLEAMLAKANLPK